MLKAAVKRYVILSFVQAGVVYALYTPYVFLWLQFSPGQFLRWLEGGILFTLATGWFIAWVILRANRWWDA